MKMTKLLLVFLCSLTLIACAAKPQDDAAGSDASTDQSDAATDTSGSSAGSDAGSDVGADNGSDANANAAALADQLAVLGNSVYYFAFDSSILEQDTVDVLEQQADVLVAVLDGQQYTVSLAGYADERGTQEYNLALGARRADEVARFLRAKGVPSGNINTTSYGEENPAALGSGEDVWALNRRVEATFDIPAQQ